MSAARKPLVVVVAGPNGAGKSSAAEALLRGRIGIDAFVNADVIAAGLNPGDPQSAANGAQRTSTGSTARWLPGGSFTAPASPAGTVTWHKEAECLSRRCTMQPHGLRFNDKLETIR